MARVTKDTTLTTRSARERLPIQHEPHWRGIDAGLALGYRKTAAGGLWMARRRTGGRYQKVALGRVDDTQQAGEDEPDPSSERTILDFRQAQAAAIAWAATQRRIDLGEWPRSDAGPKRSFTVADALDAYLVDYAARGGKAVRETRTAADAHIGVQLGNLVVGRLTRANVRDWHRALASTAPRRRRPPGVSTEAKLSVSDPDTARARQATANRILTILKAALNHAREEGHVTCSPDAWTLVKPFAGADAPKIQYLSDAGIIRLLKATSGDFRTVVTAALLTGCRYGELAAMAADAFDHDARTIFVAPSKSGKSRHVVLTDEGAAFFQQQVAGKIATDLMFTRVAISKQATRSQPAVVRRVAWGKSDQFRAMEQACKAASIFPAISFHVLRHTYASRLATNGASLQVIAAQLGHAGTRMTERHYAHLAPSHVATEVRAKFGLIGVTLGNVAPMHRSQA